jgi:hypothetical protein
MYILLSDGLSKTQNESINYIYYGVEFVPLQITEQNKAVQHNRIWTYKNIIWNYS